MKRLLIAVAAMALLVFGLGTPAFAAEMHHPSVGWNVQDFSTEPGEPAESEIVDADTVKLTKPDGATGTSVETTNLDLAGGGTLTVHYSMSDGATGAAGAVRMFWYDHPDADTSATGTAPTDFKAAEGTEGDLTLDIPEDKTIGTFGLTYDSSNDTSGTVIFTGLALGETAVLFVAPEPEPTQSATPSPEPSASATTPAPVATTEAPAVAGPQLPVTGDRTRLFVGIAGVALVGGIAALVFGRKRRVRTEV